MMVFAQWIAACGFVGLDAVDGGVRDAPRDGAFDGPIDAIPDGPIDAIPDGPIDATRDVPEVDAASATGTCGAVTEATCPNLSTRLGPEAPTFAFTIPNFNGLANNVDAPCFAPGGSDWTLLVEPTADGFIEPLVRPSVGRVALTDLAGGCGGMSMNCSNPAPSFSRSAIRAGESFVLVVEAQGTCGEPVDVTLTYVP